MLLEAWQKLVEYVPQKDRLDAARAYVTLIDDFNLDQASLEEIKDSDHYLEAAISEYYAQDEDDRYEDEQEEW
tara:strand:+ start:27236 stop:27454 length:219 start_codon:yes stop_codon:yes gene_type:complete